MRVRACIAVLLLGVLALVPLHARAQVLAYAVDTNNDLYRIDLTSATPTLIGATGVTGTTPLEGLALSPGGALFATSTTGDLYGLSTATGAATLIGSTGLGNVEGLDFSGSTLLGTDFSARTTVYSIDTGTAAPTLVVTGATGVVRTMTVADSNNVLVASDSPVAQTLANIDLTSGTVTDIGTLPAAAQMTALDFGADGKLYGLDGAGNEYIVSPSTGAGTLVGSTGSQFWLGIAAIPAATAVPEPTSLALLVGCSIGALVAFRRSRPH